MAIGEKPMVIKGLSKKYEIESSENKDYIALKPLSLYMEEKEITSFYFCQSVGIKVSKIFNNFFFLLLIKIGIYQMPINNSLYEIPKNFRVYHFCLCVSNKNKNFLT